jgi:Protein of unknown function (DUF3060)
MKASCPVLMLFLAAIAVTATAEDRIAVKADGAEVALRSDGSIKVVVETRDGAAWLSIHDSHQTGTLDCKGRHVAVSGEGNKLRLTGTCLSVEVSGDSNELVVDVLGEASLAGDENRIEWKRAASGSAPEVSDSGDDNTVRRATAG